MADRILDSCMKEESAENCGRTLSNVFRRAANPSTAGHACPICAAEVQQQSCKQSGTTRQEVERPNKAVMKARADCPHVASLAIYTLLTLLAMDNLQPSGHTGSIQTPDFISDSRTWIQAASIRSLHLGHGPVAPALLDSGYHNNALRPWAVDRHAMLSSSGS